MGMKLADTSTRARENEREENKRGAEPGEARSKPSSFEERLA